jgi:hypothetical protein
MGAMMGAKSGLLEGQKYHFMHPEVAGDAGVHSEVHRGVLS